MKSLGFVLIVLGILVAYLGFNGKLKDAMTALKTGQVPGDNVQLSGEPSNGFQVVG